MLVDLVLRVELELEVAVDRWRRHLDRRLQPFARPEALTPGEIAQVIEDYRRATDNALAAGFDGVELHCTSGYLPAQFLCTGSNQRTDRFGGSVQNRVRFAILMTCA